MNYTLHQLKVFLSIAELKSITKAAEVLHLSQPAVSIQLKNFQDQFEVPLTEVVGRQLYVTDFGLEIADASKKILSEVDEINNKVLKYQGQISGTINASVVSTGKYVMPFMLADFLKEHTGVELKMDVTNKSEVVQSLVDNTVDFSLVSIQPERMQLRSIPLMENKLYLVGNHEAELDNQQTHSLEILKEIELIFREPGSGTRETIEKHLLKNNLSVAKKLVLKTNEAVKQAVIAGLGYSIMPLIGIRNEIKRGDLKIIPIEGFPLVSQWQLVWLKEKKHSPAVRAYLEYLHANKETVVNRKFKWYSKFK